jgi:beta-lactamase class A
MKKWLNLAFGTMVFLSLNQIHAQTGWKEMLSGLPQHLELSLLVQDKEGKVLLSQQAQKKVPSASIIKIPILISLMEAVEKGKINLEEVYSLQQSDKVGGAGEMQHLPEGSGFTYRYMAEEMIRISDNTATNILIRTIGLEKIQNWLVENGFKSTQLNRFMMDFEAISEGRQNYTSPEEMNRILLLLFNGEILTASSRAEIIYWLKNCADKSTLPSQLPPGVELAHKTGTLDYVRGDAGIILVEMPLFISLFVENFNYLEEAEDAIGAIGLYVYEAYGK